MVGDSFNPANGQHLHGSTIGLIIGLLGLIYGAQGVTQTAQQAMATVWDVPQFARTGFLPRLGRSLAGLLTIGGTFLINAPSPPTSPGRKTATRSATRARRSAGAEQFPVLAVVQDPHAAQRRGQGARSGAILGGVVFTALITVGTGLVTHQLKNASNTYGTFGSVIGIVTFLLLLAKLSIYAAELNPVLHRKLYPRALPMGEMTEADKQVQYALIHEQRRTEEETIGVGFGPDAPQEAAADALATGRGAGQVARAWVRRRGSRLD